MNVSRPVYGGCEIKKRLARRRIYQLGLTERRNPRGLNAMYLALEKFVGPRKPINFGRAGDKARVWCLRTRGETQYVYTIQHLKTDTWFA